MELVIDCRFESDVNVAGALSPNVRATPALRYVGPASNAPIAAVAGRFVRDVTPTTATGKACRGPFSYCYILAGASLVDLPFAQYGTLRPDGAGGTVRDFGALAGSRLTFGALGYDGRFSIDNEPAANLFDARFKFDFDLTCTRPHLALRDVPTPIPLPATMPALLGAALLLGSFRRRRA